MKPTLIEKYADNGAFSHYELIDSDTGETLWSEDDEIGLKSVLDSLSELVRTLVRISNSDCNSLLHCDILRLNNAKEILKYFQSYDNTQLLKQS